MNGFPKDFDSSLFIGLELLQLGFTVNTIHLIFDSEVSITILASFTYRLTSSEDIHSETVPVSSSGLMQLLGQKVRAAIAKSDGSLTLLFQEGSYIICLDDSLDYESYLIHIGNQEIVV